VERDEYTIRSALMTFSASQLFEKKKKTDRFRMLFSLSFCFHESVINY